MLRGKGEDRGRAAENRGHGSAVKVIGCHDPQGAHLLDVAMALDAPGQDQHPGGINGTPRRAEVATERNDLAATDGDVALGHVRRRGHGPIANEDVKLRHALLQLPNLSIVMPRFKQLQAGHPVIPARLVEIWLPRPQSIGIPAASAQMLRQRNFRAFRTRKGLLG